jgi:hypothetical protein
VDAVLGKYDVGEGIGKDLHPHPYKILGKDLHPHPED